MNESQKRVAPGTTRPQDVARLERALALLPLPPAPSRFVVGDSVPGLSSWILERQLGGGGFGEVWLVRHEWKDKRRAVKFCTHPAVRHRLVTHEKEVVVRVMKYGQHPNIVPLLECNLEGETPWLMYEYVTGGTLADAFDRWRRYPLARRLGRCVKTLRAIAGALAQLHQLNPPIVHRDLKPHNVLMEGKHPRITDFGIGGAAVGTEEAAKLFPELLVQLPVELRGGGSRRYAPPEQMFGSKPHPRDDVYALGVIAYQMAMDDLEMSPGTNAIDELRERRLPPQFLELIVRSVSLNPDHRPVNAGEWVAALSALVEIVPPSSESSVQLGTPEAPQPGAHPTSAELPGSQSNSLPTQPPTSQAPTPQPPTALSPSAKIRALAELDFRRGAEYYHGHGVPQDYMQAHEWFAKAAARKHANAQNYLGILYDRGLGVTQDSGKARECYEKAAEQGHAPAQFNLAGMYASGRGGVQDYAKARDLYEKAARQDHSRAQYNLGRIYKKGKGVPKDIDTACEWFSKAAASGHPRAKRALERIAKRK